MNKKIFIFSLLLLVILSVFANAKEFKYDDSDVSVVVNVSPDKIYEGDKIIATVTVLDKFGYNIEGIRLNGEKIICEKESALCTKTFVITYKTMIAGKYDNVVEVLSYNDASAITYDFQLQIYERDIINDCIYDNDCTIKNGYINKCINNKCEYLDIQSGNVVCKQYEKVKNGNCVISVSKIFTSSGISPFFSDHPIISISIMLLFFGVLALIYYLIVKR